MNSSWRLNDIQQFKYYIYQIECTANGKKYVGRTQNLPEYRIIKHFQRLRTNRHTNASLQADFNRYKEEAFTVTWLCATNDKLAELEWMMKLKTYDPRYGYNDKESYFWTGRWSKKSKRVPKS